MNFLNQLKIGRRLTLAFISVLSLSTAVGVLSIHELARVNDDTRELATNWMIALRALGAYSNDISTVRRAEARYIMAKTAADAEEQIKRVQEFKGAAAKNWQVYEATVTTDEERVLAKNIRTAEESYYIGLSHTLAVPQGQPDSRDRAEAAYLGDSIKGITDLGAALKADMDFQTKNGDEAYRDSQATFANARYMIVLLLLASLGLGCFLSWAISRSILRPLARALKGAETVAAGDLTSNLHSDDADELGQLLRALNRMNQSLVAIVTNVRNSSDSIATGSSQIAAGSMDLSQRTEEQASNLQQTAASMEQLTATVKQNADVARSANQLASSAVIAASDGGRVVSQVVATMNEISQASRKVGEIVSVIDGIAFQTNILALNAAVEAARAGEQGRGFAVVASEVRSLAQRSATAAKEIKSLIGSSVERVETGSRLVSEAGGSIDNIVSQVTRVSDLIGEISSASVEQSTGIGQVGEAVNQLDQVTQQNAALVEESASAADSLKVQAARLSELVSVFNLGMS